MPIENFNEGYHRIKENCSIFAGDEAQGVSSIYKNYSYVFSKSDLVVLDVEVSLKAIDKNRKQDRIDVLIYDQKNNVLQFCEAKHYSNKEIWSQPGIRPEVVEQVYRYQEQIKFKNLNIIEAYKSYVAAVNKLFELNLPIPKTIYEQVILIVFGFDKDQLIGRYSDLFKKNIPKGLICYSIGNIANIKLENMAKKCK